MGVVQDSAMSNAKRKTSGSIRDACLEDVAGLDAIEQMSFDGDRVSKRSFRHLLIRGNCRVLVDCVGEKMRGYVVILFRAGTGCARIYSIATHPQFLKRGIASRLVKGAQAVAVAKQCHEVRLEIRQDNHASVRMFQMLGYHPFGRYSNYYEDGMDAMRFRKSLLADTTVSTSPQ